jgi:hypothetical protein
MSSTKKRMLSAESAEREEEEAQIQIHSSIIKEEKD